jgi:hypothetical protein
MLREYKKAAIEPAQHSVMILYRAYIIDKPLLHCPEKKSIGYQKFFRWE